MDNNLFADFVSKFLNKLDENNLRLFYQLFFIDKSVGVYNFSESISYRARITRILLETEQSEDRSVLIQVLKAIYFNYYSLCIISRSMLLPENLDKSVNVDGFASGDLKKSEFNVFFKTFFELFSERKVMYYINNDKLIAKYYEQEKRVFNDSVFRLEKQRKNVLKLKAFNITKKINRLSNCKNFNELKGIKSACKFHLDIINALPPRNIECVWCTPIIKTKHKCPNCVELHNVYEDFVKNNNDNPLPKDLNQIIKRIKAKNTLGLNEYRKNVKTKLLEIIKTCKNNQSSLIKAINNSFGQNEKFL